jgi:hypothetical protein
LRRWLAIKVQISIALHTVTGIIEADTSATINVQHSMITSNTNGACIYLGSTASIATTTVIADNVTNIEACGGAVNGAGGAAPSPKI